MKLLIVVDCQNDFITGSLGTREAQEIVPRVIEKIKQYNSNECKIFATMDTHDEFYFETMEGKKLPIKHCIENTDGWKIEENIDDELLKNNNSYKFIKRTFGFNNLPYLIAENENIESIELIGLCTDICVVSNALLLKTYFPEVPIIVDASCCAGVTPETHLAALTVMKQCQIDVINE